MNAPQKTDTKYSEKEVLQEERYLWMARAFSLVALLAFVADILMLIALSGLTPLLRVQPFYFQTQDKEHQVISVVRPDFSTMNDRDLEVLQESLVREYLLARYGVSSDVDEVEKRWGIDGIVFAMSESSVYKTFYIKEADPTLKMAKDDGLTRDVRIKVVNLREKRANGFSLWTAELETIDMSQKINTNEVNKWNIKMEVVFRPTQKMEWSQRLKNPLGFMVTNFGREPMNENDGAS